MGRQLLILASASPRRAALLREAGLEFEVAPSRVTETMDENLSAGELAQVNAYRKARSVSKKFPDAVTLGVDTVVTLEGQVFGKPANEKEAHSMLAALQGRTHQVVTGVCLIHLRAHRQTIFAEHTDVTFRKLTADQIKSYTAQVHTLDKAGAYGIQEKGEMLIASREGSSPTSSAFPWNASSPN